MVLLNIILNIIDVIIIIIMIMCIIEKAKLWCPDVWHIL